MRKFANLLFVAVDSVRWLFRFISSRVTRIRALYEKQIRKPMEIFAGLVFIILALPGFLDAQTPTFTVTTNGDGTGSVSGSSPNFSATTLRAALNYINTNKATIPTSVINLPSGVTISLTSELYVANDGSQTITINGNNSTINGNSAYRCLDVDYSANGNTNVTVNNLTLTGGHDQSDTYGGGAVLAGTGLASPVDQLTLSNCTITNSQCTNGGGGGGIAMWAGALTLTSCTLSGNTATNARGGGLKYGGNTGTISISNCTFSNNTTSANSGASSTTMAYGGAIDVDVNANVTCTISNTSFSNNTATTSKSSDGALGGAICWYAGGSLSAARCAFVGNNSTDASGTSYGGAISGVYSGSTTFNINYSRFYGNTAKGGGNCIYTYFPNSPDATSNWWGSNGGPGGSDLSTYSGSGSITTSPYLQLRHQAARTSISTGDTTLLTSDIRGLSTGGATSASNLSGLPTFTATFGNATGGSLSSATNFVNGIATAVFTAGSSAGTGSADVTADAQTVTLSPTISVLSNVSFADGSSYVPPIPVPNTSDNPVGRFKLTAAGSGASLSAIQISFAGTGTNVSGVKLWESLDNAFGGDVQIGTTQAFASAVSFGSLSSSISTGGTYYFVTLDLGSSTGWTSAAIADNAALTLSNGTLTTTINNAQLSAADVSLPVELSSFSGRSELSTITLSWSTRSEVDNAGFNVLRRLRNTADWLQVGSYKTDDNLKGLGTSSTGRAYTFVDRRVKAGATYEYELQSVSISGSIKDGNVISVTADVPKEYALLQNYPNPFNPSTAIRYQLSEVSRVTIMVYDMLGCEVETLVNERQDAGVYDVTFNGARLPSGVYYCRMSATGDNGQRFVSTKKLVLLR